MLGRVRACSLSSLELLEMERTPSKLPKDDSFSIYETTLMKLKQGSQRDLCSTTLESKMTDTSLSVASVSSDEALVELNAPGFSSEHSFQSLGDCQSMIMTKERPHGNLSVPYLFSRYKSSQNNNPSSSDKNAMAIEDMIVQLQVHTHQTVASTDSCEQETASPVSLLSCSISSYVNVNLL